MAMWDGSLTPVKREWRWRKRRVYSPFRQCDRSKKFLFLKKAYYGRYYVDWEFYKDSWLSSEEYMLATLREDFDER
jgi:hypothetical protein